MLNLNKAIEKLGVLVIVGGSTVLLPTPAKAHFGLEKVEEKRESTVVELKHHPQCVIELNRPVSTEWLVETGEDRQMKVTQRLEFTDCNGVNWSVPKGAIIDGASIPRWLWEEYGSPFVGDYRLAAVFHDYYTKHKIGNSEDVHRMFVDLMLASGVEPEKAYKMYAAAVLFGPNWYRDGIGGVAIDTTLDWKNPAVAMKYSRTVLKVLLNSSKYESLEEVDLALDEIQRSPIVKKLETID